MKQNRECWQDQFDQLYEIMEASFPEIERRSYEGQKRLLQNPLFHLLVKEEAGAVQAFLTYWTLSGCTFIEHLATKETCRGKGLGRDLVLECIDMVNTPLFLEIEPVDPYEKATARRAAFYQRMGFYLNDFPYQQPPLQPQNEWMDLQVMSYGKPVGEKMFQPHKAEIYNHVYQVKIT